MLRAPADFKRCRRVGAGGCLLHELCAPGSSPWPQPHPPPTTPRLPMPPPSHHLCLLCPADAWHPPTTPPTCCLCPPHPLPSSPLPCRRLGCRLPPLRALRPLPPLPGQQRPGGGGAHPAGGLPPTGRAAVQVGTVTVQMGTTAVQVGAAVAAAMPPTPTHPPCSCSPELRSLLASLLSRRPECRPSMEQVGGGWGWGGAAHSPT